ncbi:hypothetical protein LSAT2_003509 [Lamellibrachia satsuma]|nr:hypothetical protein LSAT2_003509 [Lamellibrachia satsuma]
MLYFIGIPISSQASLCDVDTKTVTDNVRKDIRSCQRNGIIRINSITQKRRHHKATAKEMTKSCHHSSSDRKKKDIENGGMQTQMSGREMTCHASLVGSNKEKKYVLDVEMYRHNQAAFQHDVCRFMIRNCRPIRRLPMWHDTPVSLFQLFLAVHQRGGYLQVCDQRDWTAVYIEVTADHRSSSRGMLAKQYYKRNLLPYELYISGHDYKEALTQSKPKNSLLGNSRGSFSQDPADHTDQDPGSDSQSTDSDRTEGDTELDEVKGILGQMDNITAQCDFSYLDDTEHTELQHSSLVMFYDESSDRRLDDYRLADTASEFGVADTPGEDATQEVPDLCSLVSSDGGEEGEDVSVGLNVEEMLQDVAVMQREIDQLEENMYEPW